MKPEKIGFPSNEIINDICCGSNHTLVLSSDGTVYGWGWNKDGQLGLNKENYVNEPQVIEINLFPEKFKYIYCCHFSSFAINSNGLLFSWGYNFDGILGQGFNQEKTIPRVINLFNVQKISSDYKNSYFLTNEGSIYFCNKTQQSPKKINDANNIFTKMEINYCCDTENNYYELISCELKRNEKYDSFIEIFAKELDMTQKMVHINPEIKNSKKCKFLY